MLVLADLAQLLYKCTVYIPWNRPLDIAAPPNLLTVFGVRVHCLIVGYVVEEHNHARIQTPRKF